MEERYTYVLEEVRACPFEHPCLLVSGALRVRSWFYPTAPRRVLDLADNA